MTERLKRLEGEIGETRLQHRCGAGGGDDDEAPGDQLRAERATLTGRRNSLEGLIREHSYSTDTVKNLFRATAKRPQAAGRRTGAR